MKWIYVAIGLCIIGLIVTVVFDAPDENPFRQVPFNTKDIILEEDINTNFDEWEKYNLERMNMDHYDLIAKRT